MVTQVLIAGGGLAGSAAAILLGRAGMSAHLLEREKGPCDKMCGEFLSIEAQQHLRLLEMNCMALGAVPIDRARIIHGATIIEAALPFVALGLSRKRLDEALLEQSARAGAHVERGVRVREIVGHDVLTTAGARTADHVFLATGKHDVRGTERPDARRSDYVAFKMHWKLATAQREALGGAIELIVFDGGYAGLQCVEGGVANLCLVIRRGVLASTGKRWADVLAHIMREPHIMRRLSDAEPLFQGPITAANLPYGYVCDASSSVPAHIFRLGDQGAMTASLTGDGMAIALRSACLAVDSLKAGHLAACYHARLNRDVAIQVKRAMLLQHVTESAILKALGVGMLKFWPQLLDKLAGLTRLPNYREQRE